MYKINPIFRIFRMGRIKIRKKAGMESFFVSLTPEIVNWSDMKQKITCLLPVGDATEILQIIHDLQTGSPVKEVITLEIKESLSHTGTLKKYSEKITTEYTLIYMQPRRLQWGAYALDRMLKVAEDTGAGLVYSDRYKIREDRLQAFPVIDYQKGSLRDDFDFGTALLYRTEMLKKAVAEMDQEYRFAALYDLRLNVSRLTHIFRISEFLYTEPEIDTRRSGEKIFDYVDPKNREVQIEMEAVCTHHLKKTGAWLQPEFREVSFSEDSFPVEATVVIPVRNREKTIEDAVRSVFQQQTDFAFNLIVVDNHSTDATTSILQRLAREDSRLIHVLPERNDLGIGGCWNEAIMHPQCGKFAVQLDSDDLYINDQVLTRIVLAFYEQQCAMVVGTYSMVNFRLESIPPGIIDHREWTPDNGRNNALRINGLGAPRAFYTPVLREIKIPNVSYGEDYAIGLAISRDYRIGRIYEPLYLCRRWEDNSDAALDVHKMNTYNLYKDKIRTFELIARLRKNGK